MGGAFSRRRNESDENGDVAAFKYPPQSGNFFDGYFYMDGSLYKSLEPEAFLFGDCNDLNYLGCQPVHFPYEITFKNEPTRALRALFNVRKDSVRLQRLEDAWEGAPSGAKQPGSVPGPTGELYTVQFTLDSLVPCLVTVYCGAKEDFCDGQLRFSSHGTQSETVPCTRGTAQSFRHANAVQLDVLRAPALDTRNEVYPLVIHCVADGQPDHSQATLCALERTEDGAWQTRVLKQKQIIDGVSYVLGDFRAGVEDSAEGQEDAGTECVMCMEGPCDTLLLPCRHLCLCAACGENVRRQTADCPVCRAPFRALVQVQVVRPVRASESCNSKTREKLNELNDKELLQPERHASMNIHSNLDSLPESSETLHNDNDNDNESVTTECSELASITANLAREKAGPSVNLGHGKMPYVHQSQPHHSSSNPAGWQATRNAAFRPGYAHYGGPPPAQRPVFQPPAHVHHHQVTTTCFSASTVQHGHAGMGSGTAVHTHTTTMSVCCVAPPMGVGVVQQAVAVQHTSIVQRFETASFPVPVSVVPLHDDSATRNRARFSMDVGPFAHPHAHAAASAAQTQARMTRSMHETAQERIHEVSDEDNESETIEMHHFSDREEHVSD